MFCKREVYIPCTIFVEMRLLEAFMEDPCKSTLKVGMKDNIRDMTRFVQRMG